MPSQSLYRKWRSRTFAELIGQDHVRETLSNALRSGRVSHAYLFCGPRGTGKTSTARLLAKTVNCQNPAGVEPCNQCESCLAIQQGRALDMIEIDAASNRGIDEIRDLRDKVGFAPSVAKFKVYILDEVHMLTTEAFNALLKTLEEPPPHAIFVLVTTEPHKIPPTITSRCQRFDFRRIGLKDLLTKLERVCREEGIDIEPAALELVARGATGSFRDAESLLDQLAAYGTSHITVEYVRNLMGLIPAESVAALVDALLKHDVAAGMTLINDVADAGHDLRQFNREIVEHLHSLLMVKAGSASLLSLPEDLAAILSGQVKLIALPELMRSLRIFSQADQALRNSAQPQLPLELAFLDASADPAPTVTHPRTQSDLLTGSAPSAATSSPSAPLSRPSAAPAVVRPVAVSAPVPPASPRPPVRSTEPEASLANATASTIGDSGDPARPIAASELTLDDVRREWPRVLTGVGQVSRSIEGLLRGCEPVAVEDGSAVLGFPFAFHKDRIEDPKNKVVVEKVLGRVLGRDGKVRCVLSPKGQGAQPRLVEEDPSIRAMREVFPGAQIEALK